MPDLPGHFVMIPNRAFSLPTMAFKLYALLVSLSMNGQSPVAKREVFDRCRMLDRSPKTLRRVLAFLEGEGWIRVGHRLIDVFVDNTVDKSVDMSGGDSGEGVTGDPKRDTNVPPVRNGFNQIADKPTALTREESEKPVDKSPGGAGRNRIPGVEATNRLIESYRANDADISDGERRRKNAEAARRRHEESRAERERPETSRRPVDETKRRAG